MRFSLFRPSTPIRTGGRLQRRLSRRGSRNSELALTSGLKGAAEGSCTLAVHAMEAYSPPCMALIANTWIPTDAAVTCKVCLNAARTDASGRLRLRPAYVGSMAWSPGPPPEGSAGGVSGSPLGAGVFGSCSGGVSCMTASRLRDGLLTEAHIPLGRRFKTPTRRIAEHDFGCLRISAVDTPEPPRRAGCRAAMASAAARREGVTAMLEQEESRGVSAADDSPQHNLHSAFQVAIDRSTGRRPQSPTWWGSSTRLVSSYFGPR